ncbi:tRNA methyltransferase 10 homolog B-like [Frankliniella occidentalis]|uniref:tRNA methyltransferase 10 homolog B-like n=1 Tax=Frankliniella occidentalis TaxID=133901 RepID=A0A6J1SR56_FRAOC|nr:tRNA methyltransferase 10 homolog B-like [Frankliniella occidentalis]
MKSWMISKEEVNVPQPLIHYLSHNTSCVAGVIDEFQMKQRYRGVSGQFGQNFVLDFSSLKWIHHDHRMILASEIRNLVVTNGKSRRPFHLHFCSYLENESMLPLIKYLEKGLLNSAVTLTADSYLNKFLRKDIVYLTPHSVNKIKYNPEDIYVISPYHERRYHVPRRDRGIRTATLPYDFKWRQGNTWLSLPEIHQLLTSWKELKGQREQKIKFKTKK